jgi:hypothetical protein
VSRAASAAASPASGWPLRAEHVAMAAAALALVVLIFVASTVVAQVASFRG